MATVLPNTDNNYLHILEQAKQDLWNRNSHLSEQQRQELWLQAASTPSNAFLNTDPSLARHIPRSMSYGTAQTPTLHVGSMDRTRSAPAASHGNGNGSLPQPSVSDIPAWQPSCEEVNSDYTLYPQSASIRKQPVLECIDETSTCTNGAMVEYTPDEYIDNCIEPPNSSPFPLPHSPDSHRPHVQLTTNSQWSTSLDGSISPSTPSTALMTPVTLSSNSMSRQSSFNPQFLDEVSMLRVHSDSSSSYPLLSEDGPISFSFDVDSKSISDCVDSSHFLNFTGTPSEAFFSPAHVSSSASALGSSENKSYLAEDMRRSASSSSESDASNASASSTSSRQSRREREIIALANSRKIAPKAIESNDETRSASSSVQMVRIRSEDGSSRDVGVITKTPYIRPQHPKIMCQYCNERPDGFRGTHELDRHVARAHAAVRKGYICVDASPNKKFLANCKHCRNKKVYGAYYNAAAHLRRAHFHPRKRGRKGKHDEKRGGIGGGDDPPMEVLKHHWIKEIEVDNKHTSPSPSESASECADSTYESIDASYPSQPTNDVPNLLDSSQYVDYGMFVNASEPMFNPSAHFASYNDPSSSNADINNFQFDVYMS